MAVYYNEIEPYCVEWLKNLITAGEIPDGEVDHRPIQEVQPEDLIGFKQCHFFAGIGGWVYAAKLADWPEDKELWTGSCPCQPFSVAGNMLGERDKRHLWPELRRLIAARKPSVAAGEQVASKAGREWLSGVRSDLEALGYAVGAADLCAACVCSPQVRQRIFWIAESASGKRREGYESYNRLLVSKKASSTITSNCFADARSAMAGNYSHLLSDDGISLQVERNRAKGYGNAIVPQVAAEFLLAYLEVAA